MGTIDHGLFIYHCIGVLDKLVLGHILVTLGLGQEITQKVLHQEGGAAASSTKRNRQIMKKVFN